MFMKRIYLSQQSLFVGLKNYKQQRKIFIILFCCPHSFCFDFDPLLTSLYRFKMMMMNIFIRYAGGRTSSSTQTYGQTPLTSHGK
jgi:hypothetical protein